MMYGRDARLQAAYDYMVANGLPMKAYTIYRLQYCTARQNKIPFEFTFKDWWAWWQVDDRWARKGRGRGKLVMARYGNIGPYSLDNVYCTTNEKNLKSWEPLRGHNHHKSKPVRTPNGVFDSASTAAKAYGISRQAASDRARKKNAGFGYESN